ncbi:MAG TPA: TetR family transcriptional regulator [Rhizomicrobium sp.]|nr:TetR family transcriptional regulator [Rhizomicrobium sp.]
MGEDRGTQSNAVWQRNEMRATMLSVARQIVERDGLAELSLNAVAEEAAIAPVTVYACFPSKSDLIGSILADDLAQLAQTMRNDFPYSSSTESEKPAAEPYMDLVAAPHDKVVVAFPADTSDANGESAASDALASARSARRAKFRALAQKENDQSGEDADEPPARVDAWLERRLRVFERGLAEIEGRMADSERNSQRAVGIAEDTTKFLSEHLEATGKHARDSETEMTARIAAVEKKQRDMLAELRADAKDSASRVEAVEALVAAAHPNAAQPAELIPVWTPPATGNFSAGHGEPELRVEEPHEDIAHDDIAAEPASETPANETYLTAARRAANTAAMLSRIEDESKGFDKALLPRYLAIGGAAVIVLLLFAGLGLLGRAKPALQPVASHAVRANGTMVTSGTKHKRTLAVAPPFTRILTLANSGNTNAKVIGGLDYLGGNGVAKDDTKAAALLQGAAKAGNAVAEYWLAMLYASGTGVAADPQASLRLYEASAMQGNRKAMHALAMAYATGAGATKNPSEAARWFSQAAAAGLVNSQFNLAVLYERGIGLPQSLLDAYKWYAIAAAQGDAESAARIEALSTQLSPDDLAAAKQAAAAFRPAPLNAATNAPPRASEIAAN